MNLCRSLMMLCLCWLVPALPVMGAVKKKAPEPPSAASRTPDSTTVSYDYWVSGSSADVKPEKTRGGMFLSGGGGHVMDGWKWFVECAGHGDIVVLGASGSDVYQDLIFKTLGGVDSVETINFKDLAAASDPKVLTLIAQADGIFLAGGKQSRYINWWKGSPVGAAINLHIKAGKPLGGGSAGLAVLGEFYYGAMEGTVRSSEALRDPYDKRADIGRGFIAAPVLEGVLTDSHFMARERLGRLVAFVARTLADEKPERLAGLGIDEGSALCVEPDGTGRLFTQKKGGAWLVEPTRDPEVIQAGKPLVFEHVKVTGIGPESTVNLITREVTNPVSIHFVSAAAGKLRTDP